MSWDSGGILLSLGSSWADYCKVHLPKISSCCDSRLVKRLINILSFKPQILGVRAPSDCNARFLGPPHVCFKT